jgi:hypothetical protein
MITEQEQDTIRLLSDTELYDQAMHFMHGMGRPLPAAQINGLLNIALNNSYDRLLEFIQHQYGRCTVESEVRDFYSRLEQQFRALEARALTIIKARAQPSREDLQMLKMLLAREFIQHVLAENGYKEARQDFPPPEHDQTRNQGTPHRNQRGPAPRQGGQKR